MVEKAAILRNNQKRLTRSEIDVIEQVAIEIFQDAYLGQYERIANAIQRAHPSTLAQFERARVWADEPDLVERAVRRWYEQTASEVGLETMEALGLDIEWRPVNASLIETSATRAGWFARAMTETSMEQTQEVIIGWLDVEGGTLGDLVQTMEGVWTGPRPQTAAITETTNIVVQSEIVTIKAAGYWGYNVHTLNDNRVRPEHTEVAKNGPYPISDTEHLPPLDYNCRCFITPVREAPT